MTVPLRPRVADPILLVMMELSRRPQKDFENFARSVETVCSIRREIFKSIKRLKIAIRVMKDRLEDCRSQTNWLDGFGKDGISVDDVVTCVQEFIDRNNSELRDKLIDTIDPELLAFVRGEGNHLCPLCEERNER